MALFEIHTTDRRIYVIEIKNHLGRIAKDAAASYPVIISAKYVQLSLNIQLRQQKEILIKPNGHSLWLSSDLSRCVSSVLFQTYQGTSSKLMLLRRFFIYYEICISKGIYLAR
jgi:hypothetical protein